MLPVVLLLGITQIECFVSNRIIIKTSAASSLVQSKDSRGRADKTLQLVPDTLLDNSMISHIVPSISLSAAANVGSVIRAIQLGGIPATGMLVVTGIGLRVKTPPAVVGALQHFAAGILLTTVAKELLPEMVQAEGLMENLASAFGFFAGVGVLILLGILLPEEELPEEETPEESTIQSLPLSTKPSPSLRNRRVSKKKEAFLTASIPFKRSPNREMDTLGDELRSGWETMDAGFAQGMELAVSSDVGSQSNMRDDGTNESPSLALPIALLAAVCIDSALDGLLVGTSTALDPTTSSILSASLTVESSFLGLTIATAIRSCPAASNIKLLGTTLAPTSLLLGSVVGGGLAPAMAESPALLAGLLGFGTSATLFMVAEELLLQAHEDGADHIWWVDAQLYLGFYASVTLEKLLGV